MPLGHGFAVKTKLDLLRSGVQNELRCRGHDFH
jgi:hypothetical protein